MTGSQLYWCRLGSFWTIVPADSAEDAKREAVRRAAKELKRPRTTDDVAAREMTASDFHRWRAFVDRAASEAVVPAGVSDR